LRLIGTKEFDEAVVARLGQKPETLKAVEYKQDAAEFREAKPIFSSPEPQKKELLGVDVFLDWWKGSYYGVANDLGAHRSGRR